MLSISTYGGALLRVFHQPAHTREALPRDAAEETHGQVDIGGAVFSLPPWREYRQFNSLVTK
jgi:hypothetical protein